MSRGAKVEQQVASPGRRGRRTPPSVGNLYGQGRRDVHPFFAHPLRPGETLSSISCQGESWLTSYVQLPNAPLTYGEVMFTVVPLSALDQFFINYYAQSAEDVFEETGSHLFGSGQVVGTANVTQQGHRRPGLQQVPRRWAGEIGGFTGATGIASSSYIPIVSFATYAAVEAWYDIDRTNDYTSDNLFDNPPFLAPYIRSSSTSGFSQLDPGIDVDISTATALSQLVEGLYIMTNTDMTYTDILAAHGVDPRRVSGIPRPVLIDHGLLQGRAQGSIGGPVVATSVNVDQDDTLAGGYWGDDVSSVVTSDAGLAFVGNNRPYGTLSKTWSRRNNGNMFIEEPSVLLGTFVWWPVFADVDEYGHMFDITRMVSPGHWGQRQWGGVDEEDFFTVQSMYERDGAAVQTGRDGEDGTNAFSLANLFANGDMVSIDCTDTLGNSVNQMRYQTPGGNILEGRNAEVTSKFSVNISVITDLVA